MNGRGRFAARLLFLRASIRDWAAVGSVTPSSTWLARALSAPVTDRSGTPTAVLEVGAGTGPVTKILVQVLGTGSRLDVVEADPAFLPGLRALVGSTAAAGEVHNCRVEDLDVDRRYDVIVSSLPFTNMAPVQVEALMTQYRRLLNPGGTITWVSFLGSRRARAITASSRRLERHTEVEAALARQGGSSRIVWANFPPARVTRVEVSGGAVD